MAMTAQGLMLSLAGAVAPMMAFHASDGFDYVRRRSSRMQRFMLSRVLLAASTTPEPMATPSAFKRMEEGEFPFPGFALSEGGATGSPCRHRGRDAEPRGTFEPVADAVRRCSQACQKSMTSVSGDRVSRKVQLSAAALATIDVDMPDRLRLRLACDLPLSGMRGRDFRRPVERWLVRYALGVTDAVQRLGAEGLPALVHGPCQALTASCFRS